MQVQHKGVWWHRDDDGRILWRQGDEWVMWDPDVPGPKVPPQFVATAPISVSATRTLERQVSIVIGLLVVVVLELIMVIGRL